MIKMCKKWGRYGLICPIVFLSEEMRMRLIQMLRILTNTMFTEMWGIIIIMALLLFLLLYLRSVEVYTYSLDEEVQYLGRIPILWEQQKKVYIPKTYLTQSSTGRFALKSRVNAKQELIVFAGGKRWTLKWEHLMHFQIVKSMTYHQYKKLL